MTDTIALSPTPQTTSESELDVIRQETALSRYPLHRLANKGNVSINIRKQDDKGATTLRWEVDYSHKHGQPGPLAYKLDSLVINRRIDEAGRPVPKVLRLGSLRDIAEELDLGGSTNAVKQALLQNAFAGITAKLTYKTVDRTERTLEAAFTRYSVVLTGEHLPGGQKADAVYLVLNDIYAEVLNNAPRRPLDYEYLRSLPPAPQRFYEIVSYEIFPAVKFGQRAKLPYSEFCLFSTVTRYFEFNSVKKQMYKIHQPHVKAGYLAKVEYEATTDADGEPDWNMFYTPGERAKFQQLIFSFNIPAVRREPVPAARESRAKPKEAPRSVTPALPLLGAAPEPNPEVLALVQRFYKLRFGQEHTPQGKELERATVLLNEDREWAEYLTEQAARHGKQAGGFPENFGGVLSLAPKLKATFEAEREKRRATHLKKARQSHEAAHRGAYHAFLGELAGGRLETSLPEAYRAFCEQEATTYRFYKRRAEKSDASERARQEAATFYAEENRVRRLTKYIQDNPRCGVPTFWQWDEKINPHPFPESQ